MPDFDSDVRTNGTKLARIIQGPPFHDVFSWNSVTRDTWTEDAEDFFQMYKVGVKCFQQSVTTRKN